MIDRTRSAARIAADVNALAGSPYTRSATAICRYAYTEEYERTLQYVERALADTGLESARDPLGTLVARNVPPGAPAFGIGSHCDSNRDGGRWDGTLGVAIAIEICRLNAELSLGLPLQVVAWLEEEGSGFGQMLLGSRAASGQLDEESLRTQVHELDTGLSFWDAAVAAGHEPGRLADCARTLDGLLAWIEPHIEQGRVLQEAGLPIGVVTAVAGYEQGDAVLSGRSDHAGTTPMGLRRDAALAAAEAALAFERLAIETDGAVVATVGRIMAEPGLVNTVPGRATFSLDARSVADDARGRTVAAGLDAARSAASQRQVGFEYTVRHRQPAVPLDAGLCARLSAAAAAASVSSLTMVSGAAHDTMSIAPLVPSAMVFIPCADGISHAPDESADPADAATATAIIVDALVELNAARSSGGQTPSASRP